MDEDPDMLKTCVFEEPAEEVAEGQGGSGRAEEAEDRVVWRLLPCQAGHPHYAVHRGEALQLGRSKDLPAPCHWPDVRLSGHHCSFAVDAAGGLAVTDHSANGVLVNGRRLEKGSGAALRHGDIVTLARPQLKDGVEKPTIAYLVQDPRAVLLPECPRGEGVVDSDVAEGAEATIAMATATAATTTESKAAPEAASPQVAAATDDGAPSALAAAVDLAAASPTDGSGGGAGASPSPLDAEPPIDPLVRKMEESLTCGVCQQVYHRPITCLPCMHNFCAGCYSQWQRHSSSCPQCRTAVTEVRRNHAIASVAEDYLALHPERKRSIGELEALDKKTTITDDVLRLPKRPRRDSASGGETEEGSSDDGTEGSAEGESSSAGVRWGPAFGYGSPARLDRCRACDRPDRHGYQCPASGAAHHDCVLCHQLFPARPDCGVVVQCSRCQKHFCDRYWGCRSGAGMDSLRPLREHRVDVFPPTTFRGNPVELEVLVGHTRAKGWRAYDVWLKCLAALPGWNIPRTSLGWPLPAPPAPLPPSPAASSPPRTVPPASVESPTPSPAEPAPPPAPASATLPPDGGPPGVTSTSVPLAGEEHATFPPPATSASCAAAGGTPPPAAAPAPTPTPAGRPDEPLTPDPVCCRRCTAEVFADLLFRYRLELPPAELPPSVTARPTCWYGRDCRTQRHNRSHCERYNHACVPSR